ncbi:hypothetical protein [Dethiobacter alkaliphilus]|uniref:hypothetical protein n=1 Tax=Dethiobacter alkaliphilus TaxID=427926 RepID=UPI002227E543|nr:hypothetical protein [Dethiobacter alkaliphilus]MCW3489616.1 hypothetical protein [Dethiobacter alkaliphilus]
MNFSRIAGSLPANKQANAYGKEKILARKPEKATEGKIKAAEEKYQRILNHVREMIEKQGGLASGKITVHIEVQLELEKDFAEDGYWSAESTAERILNFAKNLTGDPEKIEILREAVQEGFKAAEQKLGTLPDVSSKTYDLVMQGFDKWAGEFKNN